MRGGCLSSLGRTALEGDGDHRPVFSGSKEASIFGAELNLEFVGMAPEVPSSV